MFHHQAEITLTSILSALLSFIICESSVKIFKVYTNNNSILFDWIPLLNYAILYSISKQIYCKSFHEIFVRSLFLGKNFCLGILLYTTAPLIWKSFGIYATVVSLFHLTEFLAIAFTNPIVLSADTFVINHSVPYTLAAGASWIEFLFENIYLSKTKQNLWIIVTGVSFCTVGEILRKTAIFTAKTNFNHFVQNVKSNDHTLVTHGIYNICRHPSYVGWFYWSIGTQLILQNPVCLVVYSYITWKFFHERVFLEELNLIKFFGNPYIQYQNKVGTGLPFIFGFNKRGFE